MSNSNSIPIERTSLLASEIESVLAALESGWLVQGPYVKSFEDKWSRFTASQHSLAVTSCTNVFRPDDITPDKIEDINLARNNWMEAIHAKGISTRHSTHALHMLSFYSKKFNLRPENFPNSYTANHYSISLPLFHGITENEQAYLIDTVSENKI